MQEQVCDKTFPCLFQSLVRVRNALQKSSVFFIFHNTFSRGHSGLAVVPHFSELEFENMSVVKPAFVRGFVRLPYLVGDSYLQWKR